MRIDPITGEIINEEQETEKKTQNNHENVSQDKLAFDPITGEPVEVQSQPSGGFDPMTGKPLGAGTQSQPSGGFDPMTGKPLGVGTQSQPSGGFDPMTGKPIEAAKSTNKKKMLIPIVGVAVMAVVALVALIINSGLFLGPYGKIQKAVVNTLKEKPHIIEDLQGLEMLMKNEFTLTAKVSMDDESVEAEFRTNAGEKQIYGKLNVEDIPELSILAGIDKSQVKLQIPEVDKRVFVYDFKGKNDGYLMEEVDEDDLEVVNSLLESINSDDYDVDKLYKELTAVVADEFKSLDYEKAEKENYRVDGDKRSCSGYTAEFTEDNMVNIIDGFERVITEQCSEEMLEMLEEQGESMEDLFEDLRDEVEDMDDIELSFYLYKNKIACIKLENTDSDAEIEFAFQGGDYRLQNIKLTNESSSREETYEMKGSVSGSKEKLKFITNGNKDRALEIEYDYKNGDISIQQEGYSNIDIEGKVKASNSKIVLTLDKLVYGYDQLSGATLELTLTDSAKMDKYSGKEFDLGNASEDDWEDLIDDLEDALYDSDLEEILYYF